MGKYIIERNKKRKRFSEGGFLSKNIWYMLIAGMFCIVGMQNKAMLFAAIGVFVIAIAVSSMEHKFCWSLFLVSNIRIFDSLGTTSIVNFLLVLPLAFYFGKNLIKGKFSLMVFPLVSAFFLLAMEILHEIAAEEPVFPLIAWVLAFVWCAFATLDEDINVNKDDAAYALGLGAVFSAVIYLINNPWFTGDIINKIFEGYRFKAYGSDPNYYSLYVCVTLACLVIKSKLKILDYILIAALVCIGFFTASKMCLILMVVNLIFLLVSTNTGAGKLARNIIILMVGFLLAVLLRDYILMFMDNLFNRAGGDEMTLNSLTSGRSDIIFEFFRTIPDNPSVLFFGKGFAYHTRFGTSLRAGAHNTFLDVLFAWGMVGVIAFLLVISGWLKRRKERIGAEKYTMLSKAPAIMMLLSWMSLSCFSAGMFFFIITAVIIQLEPDTTLDDALPGLKRKGQKYSYIIRRKR